MAAADAVSDRLEHNRKTYQQLVGLVRAHAHRGDLERVLHSAILAANAAWYAPTGSVADPDLERLIRDTVARHGAPQPAGVGGRASGPEARVLHVLSEAYAVGGHTRLAWRWIERDRRPVDVALTTQGQPVPESLGSVVADSGGRIFDLREAFPSFVSRAAGLRRLMNRAGTVVLHVHPFDAIALAATLLPGPRPPVIYENHADHAFWLGLAAADVVADHRDSGQALSRKLRGVREERLELLPLSIEPASPTTTRKVVRARLGLRPAQVAAITVASPRKMSPVWGEGFHDLLERVLSQIPQLVVVIVGATAEDGWAALRVKFPQRVHALGPLPNPETLYPGMDVYLDSFPVSSGTSILEAAAAGLPPLSLLLHGRDSIFSANSAGLAGTDHVTESEEEYVTALRSLVEDPALRSARGETARREVLAAHQGPSWDAALDGLYRRAHEVPAADLDEYPTALVDPAYGRLVLPFIQGPGMAPEPVEFGRPLEHHLDPRMRLELGAVTAAEPIRGLSVRVRPGWEEHLGWMLRLTDLARAHPHLSVSLPFAGADDGSGAFSVAVLESVLAANGTTVDDCGQLSLDVLHAPVSGRLSTEEPAFHGAALDVLEDLLTSPIWDQPSTSDG